MFSLCCLHFDNHVDLAQRLHNSLGNGLREAGRRHVSDIRIGINKGQAPLKKYLFGLAEKYSKLLGIPTTIYSANTNTYKYPLMRRMFYDTENPLSEYTHWLDDDAYWGQGPKYEEWWQKLLLALKDKVMVGKLYTLPLQDNQHYWIAAQPWFNPAAPYFPLQTRQNKLKPIVTFCQGSCWFIRSNVLQQLDWPSKDLKHCGGDSMLAVALHHLQVKVGSFVDSLSFNASWDGVDSRMPRRGYTEKEIGRDYRSDKPYTHEHHDFEVTIHRFKGYKDGEKTNVLGESASATEATS